MGGRSCVGGPEGKRNPADVIGNAASKTFAAECLRLVPEHPRHVEKNDDDDWHAEKP
jgi:hypothetical protein